MNGLGIKSTFSGPRKGLEQLRGRLKQKADEVRDTQGDVGLECHLRSGACMIDVLLDTEYEDTLELIETKYMNRYELNE